MDKQNAETHNESESLELREFDQVESDVFVDDYKGFGAWDYDKKPRENIVEGKLSLVKFLSI